MAIMNQRARPRGQADTWRITEKQPGPPGSGLRVVFFLPDGGGTDECADIEEAVGATSKRRLTRIIGAHAHVRALAFMDGYHAAKNSPVVTTQYPRAKRQKKSDT